MVAKDSRLEPQEELMRRCRKLKIHQQFVTDWPGNMNKRKLPHARDDDKWAGALNLAINAQCSCWRFLKCKKRKLFLAPPFFSHESSYLKFEKISLTTPEICLLIIFTTENLHFRNGGTHQQTTNARYIRHGIVGYRERKLEGKKDFQRERESWGLDHVIRLEVKLIVFSIKETAPLLIVHSRTPMMKSYAYKMNVLMSTNACVALVSKSLKFKVIIF